MRRLRSLMEPKVFNKFGFINLYMQVQINKYTYPIIQYYASPLNVALMGKVDKKAAATSSRAAELLAKSGTGATASGFGG